MTYLQTPSDPKPETLKNMVSFHSLFHGYYIDLPIASPDPPNSRSEGRRVRASWRGAQPSGRDDQEEVMPENPHNITKVCIIFPISLYNSCVTPTQIGIILGLAQCQEGDMPSFASIDSLMDRLALSRAQKHMGCYQNCGPCLGTLDMAMILGTTILTTHPTVVQLLMSCRRWDLSPKAFQEGRGQHLSGRQRFSQKKSRNQNLLGGSGGLSTQVNYQPI